MTPDQWNKLSDREKRRLRSQSKTRSRGGTSVRKLYQSMRNYRPNTKVRDTGKAEILEVRPSNTQVPYLIVESQVRGTKLWQQLVHFTEATLESGTEEQLREWVKRGWHPVQATSPTGRVLRGQYWVVKPIGLNESIKVRCTCPDYRHSFSYQNFDAKALQGRRIPYQKVPGSNRGPRNPDDVPGVCKHIRAVIHELQRRGGNNQYMTPIPGSFTTARPGYR